MMMYFKDLQTNNRIAKVCALIAATLILPLLTYAHNNQGDNDKYQRDNDKDRGGQIATVPDNGPGIVLIATTVGAGLLFGAMRRSRPKAAQE